MHYSQDEEDAGFVSDQQQKKPQPPLVKGQMNESEAPVSLPRNFDDLRIEKPFSEILTERRSSRIFTDQPLSLLQLSFLLWASQGVKEIRGRQYATLRTVPSGGARHGFETYLIIRKCNGLRPGVYHYLPLDHELEYLHDLEDERQTISDSLCGQAWAAKASVIFYWSLCAYRCEWRYGIHAHRVALIDAGHVGQNLYLAAAGLDLGACGIAAFDDAVCSALFGLDGDEEFIVYIAPAGTVQKADKEKEQRFYQFVVDENL